MGGLSSPLAALQQDTAEELLAERDARIRELEDTVRMLKEKLQVCDMDNPEQETEIKIENGLHPS